VVQLTADVESQEWTISSLKENIGRTGVIATMKGKMPRTIHFLFGGLKEVISFSPDDV
jgi:hypothetical protein